MTTATHTTVAATGALLQRAMEEALADTAAQRTKGVRTLRLVLPQLQRLAQWGGTGRHGAEVLMEVVRTGTVFTDFVSLTKASDWKQRAETESFAALVTAFRTALADLLAE